MKGLNRLHRRERAILALTLFLGVVFVLDRWTGIAAWDTGGSLDRRIATEERQIQRDERALQNQKEIRRAYPLYARSIPKNSLQGMPALVAEIERLAQLDGVKIMDIAPQPNSNALSSERSAALVIESPWDPLAHFVYHVYKSPQLLQIQKAQLHRKNDETALLQGQLIISVEPIGDDPVAVQVR